MKVKVSVEFFDRLGRVKEELEAVDLSREVIRQLRDSEWPVSYTHLTLPTTPYV